METEKVKKCEECDGKFATLEQLQVHQRRHEMSLTIPKATYSSSSSISTPSFGKGSLSAGIIGFTDETPTPTRFFRNCEEVGLFQDLQNVNPFDEDFKKATNSASATPSGESTNAFDFTFATAVVGAPTTPNLESILGLKTKCKRRYSDQDSLNTPQVFPYVGSTGGCPTLTTNTASISACLTPTPQNPVGVAQDVLKSVVKQPEQSESPTVVSTTTTYNHVEHVSIIAHTSAISQQPPKAESSVLTKQQHETSMSITKLNDVNCDIDTSINHSKGRVSLLYKRAKTNLKLHLKPAIVSDTLSICESKSSKVVLESTNVNQSTEDGDTNTNNTSLIKTELLEKNRAASHRSRERRKQWIDGLESQCKRLETLLAQSQAEVARLKDENDSLRSQLNNLKEDPLLPLVIDQGSVSSVDTQKSYMVEQSKTKINKPSEMVYTIISPLILPKMKAKRGRPRKGEERRVKTLCLTSPSSDVVKSVPKIPIMPLHRNKK